MKTIVLPLETQATLGVNRKIILTYKDLIGWNGTSTPMVSAQAQPIVPFNPGVSATATLTMKAGTQVGNFLVNVPTLFTGCTAMAFTLGDGGSANRFVTSTDCFTGAGTGWKATGVATLYTYIAADTIDIVVTSAGIGSATAGELEIYFLERDLTGLPYVGQP